MYISWAHHYMPKVFGTLAFLVNPLFIYLVFTAQQARAAFGNYRYLLLCFSVFNMIYSLADILVPIAIIEYRYCFATFIVDGMFFESSQLNFWVFSIRCAFIAVVYALLVSHYVYRYLIVMDSELTKQKFPWFMALMAGLCGIYFMIWIQIIDIFKPTMIIRKYLAKELDKKFKLDVMQLNLMAILYSEGSTELTKNAWIGMASLCLNSGSSIAVCIVLGVKIVRTLNQLTTTSSTSTAKFQKRLLQILVAQTVIPICISFTPCFIMWISPAFGVNFGNTVNSLNVIFVSVFPFLDPAAIIICLPVLRNRLIFFRGAVVTAHMEAGTQSVL